VITACIPTVFYLRVIVAMYMSGEEEDAAAVARPRLTIPVGAGAALGLALAFTLIVGFLPEAVLDFARHATVLRL
jgi:NADH:ubiquinone oxidoreductase subunit 2 (subunit N)